VAFCSTVSPKESVVRLMGAMVCLSFEVEPSVAYTPRGIQDTIEGMLEQHRQQPGRTMDLDPTDMKPVLNRLRRAQARLEKFFLSLA